MVMFKNNLKLTERLYYLSEKVGPIHHSSSSLCFTVDELCKETANLFKQTRTGPLKVDLSHDLWQRIQNNTMPYAYLLHLTALN